MYVCMYIVTDFTEDHVRIMPCIYSNYVSDDIDNAGRPIWRLL